MRKLSRIAILIVVVALMATMAVSVGAASKPKLGAVMIDLTHPFYVRMMYAGNKAAQDYGVDVVWKSAEGSLEKELALVENFVQQKVDVILIDPIDKIGVKPAIEKAKAAGIPVITMGNLVETDWNVNTLYNDYEDCKMIAKFVGTKLNGKGNVVVIIGNKGNFCSDQREAGFLEGIKAYPGIKVLSIQPSDWDPVKGMRIMENWLATYPKIDALFFVSDAVGMGAIQAIRAANRMKEIQIFGYDGDEEVVDLIAKGEVQTDLLTGAERVGYWNIKVAADLARGVKTDKILRLPTYVVTTAENAALFKKAGIQARYITPEEHEKYANGYRAEFGPKKK
ncbi:MAG TPA: substrate-binding domain-containing protein [Firmicutes bacterium]|nr:substrate-binding domain-containing protein [Bacillota bacterium]